MYIMEKVPAMFGYILKLFSIVKYFKYIWFAYWAQVSEHFCHTQLNSAKSWVSLIFLRKPQTTPQNHNHKPKPSVTFSQLLHNQTQPNSVCNLISTQVEDSCKKRLGHPTISYLQKELPPSSHTRLSWLLLLLYLTYRRNCPPPSTPDYPDSYCYCILPIEGTVPHHPHQTILTPIAIVSYL